MNSHHLIESAVFNLTYDHGGHSIDQRSSIDDFIKRNLMIVVDEVFTEAANSDIVYRIGNLELDLGDIPYTDYKNEMPKRLREKLISTLADIHHANQIGQASNGEVTDKKNAEQASLLYFLCNGYLPWYSHLLGSDALELLLKQAIDSNLEEFCSFLNSTPHKGVVMERLIRQFSADTITYILRVLSSSHLQTARQIAAELKELLQLSISTDLDSQDNHSGYSIDPTTLQAQMISELLSGEMSKLQARWSLLYSEHAKLLKKILQYYGQQQRIRENIVVGFSETMLQDLLALIEPSEHGFVAQAINQAALFQLNKKIEYSKKMQHKAEMWEFSLAYLLVERGNRFNKKAYLGSLIKQIAVSRNWSRSFLVRNLIKNTSAYSNTNKFAYELLQFLTEQQNILKSNTEQQEYGNNTQLESCYGHCEHLNRILSDAASDVTYDESTLLVDLETVSQKTPWLLTRLCQELHANRYAWHRAIENLSIPLLHQLVQELVSATSGGNLSSSSDFMAAIQSNAERFTNQKTFFIHILDCLINDKLIDFDALESSELFQADAAVKEDEIEQPADQTNLHSQLVSALISGEMSTIQTHWSALYDDHAQLLKKTLQHYGQQLKVRKHIAGGFSQAILHDILMLIEPSEHSFVTQVIEQAALFQPDRVFESFDQIQPKTEMWEFSLAYLLVERGSQFNKKAYLGCLIKQIAASRNLSYSVLIHSLIENIHAHAKISNLARELLQFLKEQQDQLAHDISKNETHALYEHLSCALSNTEYNESVQLADLEALSQKTPWLLIKLYRQLQTGSHAWQQAVSSLTTPLLRKLVQALVTVTSANNPALSSDLNRAIKANAEQSTNQKPFFIHILKCLVKGELVDFIALEKENLKETSNSVDTTQTEDNEQHLTNMLYGTHTLSDTVQTELIRSIELMAARQPLVLRQLLEPGLGDKKFIFRMSELLPEWLQVKLLSVLGVTETSQTLQCAELLNSACYSGQANILPKQLEQFKWRFIYSYLSSTGRLFNEQYFVRQYAKTLNEEIADSANLKQFHVLLSQQLLHNRSASTQEVVQRLIQSLSYDADDIGSIETPIHEARIEPDLPQKDESAVIEDIYIANAGIVLAAAYLPRLFNSLGLSEKSAFKDREAAERGVHMLQFMVNESLSSPECQLVLNKLLCGIPPGRPISREIELTAHEKSELEGLLHGIIQHWKSLGSTSMTGLRESFLQRHGRLQLKDDAWYLSVESKSFDMLLDQIPWSYSTIKFPWMQRVVYVEWH